MAERFSIIHISDVHANAGSTTSNDWQTVKSFILTHTNDGDLNIRIVALTGDLYEGGTNLDMKWYAAATDALIPTNMLDVLGEIRNAGVLITACTGNHDSDNMDGEMASAGSRYQVPAASWNNFWTNGWLANQVGYVRTNSAHPNDQKWICWDYTNAGVKLRIVTVPWATNLPNVTADRLTISNAYWESFQWASNQFAEVPDHIGILEVHYMIDRFGQYGFNDTGPVIGLYTNIGPAICAFDLGIAMWPNLSGILAGHNRRSIFLANLYKNASGNTAFIEQFDNQSQYTTPYGGSAYWVSVITFDTGTKTIYSRTFDVYSATQVDEYISYFSRTYRTRWQIPIPNLSNPPKRIFKLH